MGATELEIVDAIIDQAEAAGLLVDQTEAKVLAKKEADKLFTTFLDASTKNTMAAVKVA